MTLGIVSYFSSFQHTYLCVRCCMWPTHLTKQFNIQTNPSIHPIVVSPLSESHPKIKSSEKGAPYTTVVNKMRTVAQA